MRFSVARMQDFNEYHILVQSINNSVTTVFVKQPAYTGSVKYWYINRFIIEKYGWNKTLGIKICQLGGGCGLYVLSPDLLLVPVS